jgi:KipI family sensor histidine kinase inhibitor
MDVRRVGEEALLLECGSSEEVRAAYAEALRRREAGELTCLDVVPAARTVLLDGVRDPADVATGVTRWELDHADDLGTERVELPVSWDGPDLESVADHWKASVDELVDRVRGTTFVVAFCGFAPGFAYLTGLPEELHVPRLAEPRSKVPAGSVGLAGPYTGIYPRSSPGGWQLVARTTEQLWDLRRSSPALLTPGTEVRFVDA